MTSAQTRSGADAQQLRQQIERTREQLGETVEQLTAKADVQARARGKATELAGRVKGGADQARVQAVARAGSLRDQLAGHAANGARNARQHRVPLAVVAGMLVAGLLVIRWRTRR